MKVEILHGVALSIKSTGTVEITLPSVLSDEEEAMLTVFCSEMASSVLENPRAWWNGDTTLPFIFTRREVNLA